MNEALQEPEREPVPTINQQDLTAYTHMYVSLFDESPDLDFANQTQLDIAMTQVLILKNQCAITEQQESMQREFEQQLEADQDAYEAWRNGYQPYHPE